MALLRCILIYIFSIIRFVRSDFLPQIRDVSAMCTSSGITASVIFDRPFSGVVYSMDYSNVHECVYYNSIQTESLLFSIPTHNCGTRVSHNPDHIIDTIENRVYVQMDKYTQTAADRQFAFVCQQNSPPQPTTVVGFVGNEVRRHPGSRTPNYGRPIVPLIDRHYPPWLIPPVSSSTERSISVSSSVRSKFPSESRAVADGSINRTYGNKSSWSMLNPSSSNVIDDFERTVPGDEDKDLLSTISPPIAKVPTFEMPQVSSNERLFATQRQSEIGESVRLEIQRGDGPFGMPINSSVKIGETLTLTVFGQAMSPDESKFNMFVHSCYAADENSTIRINLIDNSGCAIHSQVVKGMQRIRLRDQIVYYFPLKAFKFPGPSEVYFFCSVDISPDHNFAEMCTQKRSSRSIAHPTKDPWIEFSLSRNVAVQSPEFIDALMIKGAPEAQKIRHSENSVLTLFAALLSLIILTVVIILIMLRSRKIP